MYLLVWAFPDTTVSKKNLNFQLTKTTTWLWISFPHRLSKRQSPTTVLFRTTITQMIFFNQGKNILGFRYMVKHWIGLHPIWLIEHSLLSSTIPNQNLIFWSVVYHKDRYWGLYYTFYTPHLWLTFWSTTICVSISTQMISKCMSSFVTNDDKSEQFHY